MAHTAALFPAELMGFKKGRQEPPANTSPPPGPQQCQAVQRAGAAYAVAAVEGVAASLFRPLSEEIERSSYDSSEDEDDTEKVPGEPKYGESDMTHSELITSLRNGEKANASQPEVKVEEH